ncbi:MAG: AAC(3) family N-acetyltransferase [Chloroflexi bacterium]|nr:AAC(3) family N-acetyltransferase [Chloroflexota bacterium]
MSETNVIANSPFPFTYEKLVADFQAMGLKSEMVVIVHVSLSKIGYVPGGAPLVIQALMDVLTPDGTLVMPTHTGDNSDPAEWQNPPIPQAWHQIVRDGMPPFDPVRSPTRGMGVIPELFRTWPDVRRSNHPQVSFAAWGKYAEAVTAVHTLHNSLGNQSPLACIYELGGHVLLLGVGYDRNTSFHLAEYRANCRSIVELGAAMMGNGRRTWQTYTDIDFDETPFPEIGAAMENTHTVAIGKVGLADCRFFAQKTAVDFAQSWFNSKK